MPVSRDQAIFCCVASCARAKRAAIDCNGLCGHTKKRTTPAKVGPDYSGVVNDGEDVQRTSPYTVTLFTTWLQQAKRLVHDLLVLAKLQEGLQEGRGGPQGP